MNEKDLERLDERKDPGSAAAGFSARSALANDAFRTLDDPSLSHKDAWKQVDQNYSYLENVLRQTEAFPSQNLISVELDHASLASRVSQILKDESIGSRAAEIMKNAQRDWYPQISNIDGALIQAKEGSAIDFVNGSSSALGYEVHAEELIPSDKQAATNLLSLAFSANAETAETRWHSFDSTHKYDDVLDVAEKTAKRRDLKQLGKSIDPVLVNIELFDWNNSSNRKQY